MSNLSTLIGMFYGDKPVENLPAHVFDQVEPTPYVRNPTYLPLPEITNEQNRAYMLFLVSNTDVNPMRIILTNNPAVQYFIDWGDGTNSTVNSGASAEKNYSFSSLSSSTEVTIEGVVYRQAIITIRLLDEASTATVSVRLNNRHSLFTNYMSQLVDFSIAHSGLIVLNILGNARIHTKLEKIKIDRCASTGTLDLSQLADGCYSLRKVEIADSVWSRVGSLNIAFRNCFSLEEFGDIDVPLCTTLSNIFSGCLNLKKVGLINAPINTSFSGAFNSCRRLYNIGEIYSPLCVDCGSMFSECYILPAIPKMTLGTLTVVQAMFNVCTQIRTIPHLNIANNPKSYNNFCNFCSNIRVVPKTINLSGGTSYSQLFDNCYNLEVIPDIIDVSACVGTIAIVFRNCVKLQKINLVSTGLISNLGSTFQGCRQLEEIVGLDTTSATTISFVINGCSNLKSLPDSTLSFQNKSGAFCIDRPFQTISKEVMDVLVDGETFVFNSADATGAFDSSFLTNSNFSIDLSFATNMSRFFFGSEMMVKHPTILNTGNVTNWADSFRTCRQLEEIGIVNMTGATNCSNFVEGSTNIRRSQIFGIRCTHSYVNCTLSQSALVEIFNNLGTALSGATITISGNYGASSLTAGERAIATGKGWTIVG